MNKDRLEKLARWWNEASSQLETGDNEALKRKLHLMEAELRVALKSEPESGWRISPAKGLVALAVAIIAIGVLAGMFAPRPDTLSSIASRNVAATPVVAGEPATPASPVTSTVPLQANPDALPAVLSSSNPAPTGRRVAPARSPRPPIERRSEPVVSTLSEPPTTSPLAAEQATAPAREAEASLDALALLVTLEREFEQ